VFTAAALAVTGAVAGVAIPAQAADTYTVTGTLTGKPSPTAAAIPLVDVSTWLYSVDASDEVENVSTSDTGAFSFAGLAAGTYTVYFNYCVNEVGCGSANWAYPFEYLGHGTNVENAQTFVLGASTPTFNASFEIAKGSTISGTILDETGAPLSGAYVYARRAGHYNGPNAITAEDGSYTVSRVIAGPVNINAEYWDESTSEFVKYYQSTYQGGATSPESAVPLTIAAGSTNTQNISLTRIPAVKWRVVDTSGNPIPWITTSPHRFNEATGVFEGPRSGPNGADQTGWYSMRVEVGVDYKVIFTDTLNNNTATPETRTTYTSVWQDGASTKETAASFTATGAVNTVLGDVVMKPFDGTLTAMGAVTLHPEESGADALYYEFPGFSSGAATVTRQWYRDGTPIDGATDYSYEKTAADDGTVTSLGITGTYAGSTLAVYSSEYPTPAVETPPVVETPVVAPPVVTTPTVATPALVAAVPTISGTKKVGSKLTVKLGSWTPAPDALAYQWLNNGKPITGATKSSYTLPSSALSDKISVVVTGAKAGYTSATATSTTVTIAKGTLKSATPKITGAKKVGKKLTAKKGTWTSGTKLSYTWYRYTGGKAKKIAKATKSTYALKAADKGKKIRVTVTGKKSGYTTKVATSKWTAKTR